MSITPSVRQKPLYTIKMYSPGCYKIVKFKWSDYDTPFLPIKDEEPVANEGKLDNSLSRTRSRITELALSNEWDYFFTGTIDQTKFDRYQMYTFREAFSQWIRDLKKKYKCKIRFLVVPEFHKDGAVHMHGFLSGIPDRCLVSFDTLAQTQPVPVKLLGRGYSSWTDYAKKFGYCSVAPIKNPIGCAFYITKYITKELCDRRDLLGKHLFFATQKLRGAQIVGDVYANSPLLDSFLTDDFDFCSTGYVTQRIAGDQIRVDWSFPALLGDLLDEHLEPAWEPNYGWVEDVDREECIQELESYEQMILDWCGY